MHDIVNAIFYAMIYLWEAHEETRRLDGVWPPNITCHSSGPDRMSRAGTGQWRIFFANGSTDRIPWPAAPGREAGITPVPRQAVADPETELEVSSSRLPWYQKRLFMFNYLWVMFNVVTEEIRIPDSSMMWSDGLEFDTRLALAVTLWAGIFRQVPFSARQGQEGHGRRLVFYRQRNLHKWGNIEYL